MTATTIQWLGFAEIAARTGLPEANLRRWRKQFAGWCPSKTFGRAEKFRPEVMEVFLTVSKLYAERRSRAEVEDALRAQAGPVIDQGEGAPDEKPAPAMMPAVDTVSILAALGPVAEKYLGILERQAAAQEEANRLQARQVEALERRLEVLERLALGTCQEAATSPRTAPQPETQGKGPQLGQVPQDEGLQPRKRQEIVAEVRRLHGAGLGLRAIATAMRRAGWPTLSGRGSWGKGSVARILKDEVTQ